MSNKKKRAGHRAFLTGILPEVDACLESHVVENKAELVKWKATLAEQLDKILPLDEGILAELVDDEKSTEEDVTAEIRDSARLKAEVTQRLAAIDEKLNVVTGTPPQASESGATSSFLNESQENGHINAATPATQKSARVKLPKLEVRKFNGKLHEWQEFWDSFESAIHTNESLSNVDKFSYLRGLLLEPARSTIAGFALTSANYQSAVDLLKRRYGKKTAIQRTLVNELLNARPVYSDRDTARLRSFYDLVETKYRALQALEVEEGVYSAIVVPMLLEKIPDTLRLTITRGQNYLDWALGDMLNALLVEVELREDQCLTQPARVTGPSDNRRSSQPTASALFTRRGEDSRCPFCLGGHQPEQCKKVTNVGNRKRLLAKYGRCFNCTERGHRARDCKISASCKNCKGFHHASLCEAKPQATSGESGPQPIVPAPVNSPSSMLVGTESRIALQTAQALIKGSRQGRVRVLFDSGSHRSFVTTKAASNCELQIVRKEWLSISTFGQRSMDSGLREVARFDVMPLHGGKVQPIEAYVVPDISHISNEHVEVVKNDFPHLRDLWFSDVCQSKDELEIDVLIGADYLWEFQKGTTIRGRPEEPVAVHTELGWVLSGPLKRQDVDSRQEVSVNFIGQDSVAFDRASLDSEIHKLWDLESIGIKSNDDVHESFENDIGFSEGRYSVKLPWKQGHDPLPSNINISLSRMKGQLKRLRKEPEVLDEYDSIIKEQLNSGVIEKVAELEETERVHYLPHHAVIRRDAETTKLRIVYDASSKEGKTGTSLNDCLHTGPSLNPLLFEILVRFRENRVALVGDIEKAFLNIAVDAKDRDSLRFLWVEDVRDNNLSIVVYRFCRVVFGLNASPFLLNGTIRHHLETFALKDPDFVKRMVEGFYVDDLVTGERTAGKAFTLFEKARDRMAKGGFNLRKWKTNDPELRDKISSRETSKTSREVSRLEDEETYAKSKLESLGGMRGEKVLGLAWNCENDTLHFNFAHVIEKARNLEVTKRNVLSLLASLFDPLGIISPVTVSMKALFQEICSNKFDWDKPLTGETKAKWDRWIKDLAETKEIQIDRCLYDVGGEGVQKCYLHGFGDASKKAYCATVYFVYLGMDGKTHVRLVASKTRVAPLKELSIPRLELMSARILAQLMNTIRVALQSQLKIDGVKFWLDSKTALSWIQNKGEWKQFVRHRVNEILKLTAKEDWAYCSTDENPADLGSRGVLASQLKENQLWWCGPSWLTGRPDGWPAMTEAYQTPESQVEEKKSTTVLLTEAERPSGIAKVIDVNNHSTLQRLVQVTAWVKRFVNNLRASVTQGSRSTGRLEANELKDAEIEWLKSAQTELKKQHNFKQLEKELGIKTDRNVLRCEGRLLNSDLEIDARKPVILPTKHPFTRLIIEECHQRVLHSGVRATLAELRSRFWVPRGRQIVKRILGECVTCRKVTGKPYSAPPTASLPDFRVREAPPFSRVGVDFAGPLYVKQKSGEMDKAYIALFSCCVTRAVRLELVEDLSTATFRRCLRRFIARNGTPALIVSDNAKTFQATQKALTRLFNHPEVRADLERDKIEWKFNLERAPWWGGFFERMVASAKQCLKKTLGNARLSFDELSTLLTEVESTLNSRPLTYEYNEVDEEVLTPSHLIYGRRIKSLPDEIVEPDDALNHESS